MADPNQESSQKWKERIMFSSLAQAHIISGGGVGFRDKKWYKHQNDEYVCLDEEVGDFTSTWRESHHAVESLLLEIDRERKPLDHAFFYHINAQGSYEGVTWRMLKIDMSFLRIVLDNDDLTMREIIRRFVRISEDTQNGPNEPFENLN